LPIKDIISIAIIAIMANNPKDQITSSFLTALSFLQAGVEQVNWLCSLVTTGFC
jgi:hypothetical protein